MLSAASRNTKIVKLEEKESWEVYGYNKYKDSHQGII
jgi:hypothetical protein